MRTPPTAASTTRETESASEPSAASAPQTRLSRTSTLIGAAIAAVTSPFILSSARLPAAPSEGPDLGSERLPSSEASNTTAKSTIVDTLISHPDWLHTAQTPKAADLKGQLILVDYWATWCAPCIQGFPKLAELGEKYGKSGLIVIGATGDTSEKVLRIRDRVPYPTMVGAEQLIRSEHIQAFPTVALIDGSTGEVVFSAINPTAEQLEGKITSWLEDSSASKSSFAYSKDATTGEVAAALQRYKTSKQAQSAESISKELKAIVAQAPDNRPIDVEQLKGLYTRVTEHGGYQQPEYRELQLDLLNRIGWIARAKEVKDESLRKKAIDTLATILNENIALPEEVRAEVIMQLGFTRRVIESEPQRKALAEQLKANEQSDHYKSSTYFRSSAALSVLIERLQKPHVVSATQKESRLIQLREAVQPEPAELESIRQHIDGLEVVDESLVEQWAAFGFSRPLTVNGKLDDESLRRRDKALLVAGMVDFSSDKISKPASQIIRTTLIDALITSHEVDPMLTSMILNTLTRCSYNDIEADQRRALLATLVQIETDADLISDARTLRFKLERSGAE